MEIQIALSGRMPSGYDLRAFLHKEGGHLSPADSTSELARYRSGAVIHQRLPLVSALYSILQHQRDCGASSRTLGNRVMALRFFWNYCEISDIDLGPISFHLIRSAFTNWVSQLWERVGRREIKERSAGAFSWAVARLLGDALGIPTDELVGRMTMPRINAGDQNPQHDKVDLVAIDNFLNDIEDVINSLSLSAIYGTWPIPIVFRSGITVQYNGQGRRPPASGIYSSYKPSVVAARLQRNADISFEKRRSPIALRTEAECLRFIGVTGMNLQTVLDLCVGDIAYRSFGDQYRVRGFKNRKGDFVEFRIPKHYRRRFEQWLAFRAQVFPPNTVTRLFPMSGNHGSENATGAVKGFRLLKAVLERAQRPTVPPSLLRYAKVQKLVRLAAIGGNLRKVASELQHSLPTLMRSYLRGSQQMAVIEFGKFIATITPDAAKHRVRNGGDCSDPNKPERIEVASPGVPEPDCLNPAGCLFCTHYRGIESFDYLHSILSYKEFVRLRSAMSPLDPSQWEQVVKSTLERIDDHVAAIEKRNEYMQQASVDAARRVEQGDYHPSWRGWIELLIQPE